MKHLLLFIAVLCATTANAMKIATDEIDEFTGTRTLITSWEAISNGYAHVRFRLENGSERFDFKYITDDVIVVPEGGEFMLKAKNDDIVTLRAPKIYGGGIGEGAVGVSGSGHWGLFAAYAGDIKWFTSHTPRLMRIYGTDGYRNIKISEGDGVKMKKLATLFYAALGKGEPLKTASFKLTYVKKSKNRQTWEVIDEEQVDDAIEEEVMGKVNAWRAKTDEKTDYDVQIEKKR